MSKIIANLIDQPESLVTSAIKELEHLNGYPSHDTRFLTENFQRLRQKISQLKLDPDDTTGPELYHSLLAKFAADTSQLDRALGLKGDENLTSRIDLAIEFIQHIVNLPETWALKRSVACQILRANPPIKTMKTLHYRSLDSMLKRQNLAAIYLAAPYLESSAWHKTVAKQVAACSSADYERRAMAVVNLPLAVGQRAKGPSWYVSSNQAMAAVAVWPSENLAQAPVLTISLLLLAALEELQCHYQLQALGRLSPHFKWWADSSNLVSLHDGKPVSLNLLDISLNHLHAIAFDTATIKEGARQFWQELNRRYALQPAMSPPAVTGYNLDSQSFNAKLPDMALASDYLEI